jgi:hypothetical protein
LQETSPPSYGAARWQVNIPQGATITAATLSLYMPNGSYVTAAADVYGFAQDTVAAFTGASTEISSATKTTATLAWDATGTGSAWNTVGSVTSIIQEIINRPGWVANSYLGLMTKSRTGCSLRTSLYEDSGRGAKLDITYTDPVTGAAKKRRLRQGTRLGAQAGT